MRLFSWLILIYLCCSAHELFLKTDAYHLQEGQQSELYLFNGTFVESDNVITTDRIVDPVIIGTDYRREPTASDFYFLDNATYLGWQAGAAGTYVAGVSTRSRLIDLSADDFNDYLVHEGLTDMLMERQEQGIDDEPAREQYAKHVKAMLQVGDSLTQHFREVLGYPVEFVPLENPYAVTAGATLPVQLLSGGQPLANQVVQVGCRTDDGQTMPRRQQRTDADGIVQITLDQSGTWYLSTIHMTRAGSAELDYISEWATLTFAPGK